MRPCPFVVRAVVCGAASGLISGLGGCTSAERRAGPAARSAPLFEGIGTHKRQVTTDSPAAQRYFNQGLVWAYAFNHDEAIRSFKAAAEDDPQCAMAWWGVALANGPHINNPVMEPERSQAAWAALREAQARVATASAVEQDLIAALAARYADPAPADRRPLDEAYAAAMREVYQWHRADPDVATLYVEALMDLQPWDLWAKDGQPKGNTSEILTLLEDVLAREPEHPGACHLYVHAVEASPHPEKANAAAEYLRNAVPISGHLVHMPSHIDVQTGRWALAADQNRRAIAADKRYREISPRQGFYRVYMAHNHHFLAFASMMAGCSEAALQAARGMIAGVPDDFIREKGAWIDPWMMIALDVLKRFGRWEDILREPAPPKELRITTAFWHYCRGVAHAALGQVADAEREQAEFRKAVQRVPEDATMGVNPARKVLAIADHMLSGELAYRRGEIDGAVAELRKAIAIEDDLRYMEPPEWIQPVRHTLGAVLVDAGRFAEAEQVYREDLAIWPENGWALHGLAQSLRAQDKHAAAAGAEERFAKVWRRADVEIATSCLCVPGKAAAARPAHAADATREVAE
ncbi:MAG: hypothetical protein AB1716_14720 [Planctomycetota bacterium]